MTVSDSKPVLTPFQALARYQEDLSVRLANNTIGMLPGVIGTIFSHEARNPMCGKEFSIASIGSMRCSAST